MIPDIGQNYTLLGNDLIVPNKKIISITPLQAFYRKIAVFTGMEDILPFVNVNTIYLGTLITTGKIGTATDIKLVRLYASDNLTFSYAGVAGGNNSNSSGFFSNVLCYRLRSDLDLQTANQEYTCYFNGYKLGLQNL